MVAGAVVYSLVLVGVRDLTRPASLAMRTLRSAWRGLLQGGGHRGASVYALEPIEDQRPHSEQ